MSPSTRDSCLWLQLLFSAVCVFVCLRLLLTGSRGAALHESSSWSSPVIVAKIVTSLPLLLLQNRQILSVLLWFRLRLLCLPKKKSETVGCPENVDFCVRNVHGFSLLRWPFLTHDRKISGFLLRNPQSVLSCKSEAKGRERKTLESRMRNFFSHFLSFV